MVIVAVVGLLAGLAVAIAVGRATAGPDGAADGTVVPVGAAPGAGSGVPADAAPVGGSAGAATAEEAVRGFLDAEVAGDLEASFAFLADEERSRYGSPAGWVAGHADAVPPVRSFEVRSADASSVTTEVVLTPGLNQVTGLTPARAVITWQVVAGDDGVGIALEPSTVEPLHPGDAGAQPAAQAWADARRACTTPEVERPGLVGAPALAVALCDAASAPEVGAPSALGDAEAATVSTAFGPEAAAAARVVRISGPVELGAVLVPIGEAWTVIGVVP